MDSQLIYLITNLRVFTVVSGSVNICLLATTLTCKRPANHSARFVTNLWVGIISGIARNRNRNSGEQRGIDWNRSLH